MRSLLLPYTAYVCSVCSDSAAPCAHSTATICPYARGRMVKYYLELHTALAHAYEHIAARINGVRACSVYVCSQIYHTRNDIRTLRYSGNIHISLERETPHIHVGHMIGWTRRGGRADQDDGRDNDTQWRRRQHITSAVCNVMRMQERAYARGGCVIISSVSVPVMRRDGFGWGGGGFVRLASPQVNWLCWAEGSKSCPSDARAKHITPAVVIVWRWRHLCVYVQPPTGIFRLYARRMAAEWQEQRRKSALTHLSSLRSPSTCYLAKALGHICRAVGFMMSDPIYYTGMYCIAWWHTQLPHTHWSHGCTMWHNIMAGIVAPIHTAGEPIFGLILRAHNICLTILFAQLKHIQYTHIVRTN